jgi:hypothetical protein
MRVNFTPSVSSAAGEKVLAKEEDFTGGCEFGNLFETIYNSIYRKRRHG